MSDSIPPEFGQHEYVKVVPDSQSPLFSPNTPPQSSSSSLELPWLRSTPDAPEASRRYRTSLDTNVAVVEDPKSEMDQEIQIKNEPVQPVEMVTTDTSMENQSDDPEADAGTVMSTPPSSPSPSSTSIESQMAADQNLSTGSQPVKGSHCNCQPLEEQKLFWEKRCQYIDSQHKQSDEYHRMRMQRRQAIFERQMAYWEAAIARQSRSNE